VPTLTVVPTFADADNPWVNGLEMRANGSGLAVWLANDTLSGLGLAEKGFLLHWVGAGITANCRGGLAFLCDDSQPNFYGYAMSWGNFCYRYRIDNGVTVSSNDSVQLWSTAASTNPVIGTDRLFARKPAAAQPEFIRFSEVLSGTGADTQTKYRQRQSQWPSEPPPVGWNSLDCDRWGLCMGESGNNLMILTKLEMYELI